MRSSWACGRCFISASSSRSPGAASSCPKALSDEVSTSTGRLIDAVSNADLVRAFAKAAYERKFISYFLADEMNASRRLRWFLITMRMFMQSATLLLLVALVFVTARDIVAGAISLGAFTMIYLLANQIARGVQELSFRMLDYSSSSARWPRRSTSSARRTRSSMRRAPARSRSARGISASRTSRSAIPMAIRCSRI